MIPARPRLRDLGLAVGNLPPGPFNAITDVAGVAVGHSTIIEGAGTLVPGRGPVRTGVTVIFPHPGNLFREKVPAAVLTINGYGKPCGFEQIRELGELESPIALTNTLNVPLVADALVQHAVSSNPEIGVDGPTVNVVVGETNDGYLNDIQGRHVKARHVFAAVAAACGGPVPEGAVGAGTGTTCFGWKGGIGTSSRVTPGRSGGFTVGALVQSNFGQPGDLLVCGHHLGRLVLPPAVPPTVTDDRGSIMIVLATDAPLDSRQLGRLCMRAAAGLARTGSSFGHASGDFVIAFSTAYRLQASSSGLVGARPAILDENVAMSGLFPAAAEAVEEAILNSLCCATTMNGRDDHVRFALPLEPLLQAADLPRG